MLKTKESPLTVARMKWLSAKSKQKANNPVYYRLAIFA
jgi:hypothetical protein